MALRRSRLVQWCDTCLSCIEQAGTQPVAHAQPVIGLRQGVSVSNQVCGEITPLMQHAQHVERLAVNAVEQQEGEVIQLPHA